MPLHRRHLIDVADFSRDEFDTVLDTAVSMREVLDRPIRRVPTPARQVDRQHVLRAEHPHPGLI